jgi:single-stranded-DNA-specific exonuclease
MSRAAERVRQAIACGEPIAVWGDYDVDGLAGTALLLRGLTALGARVTPHIPDRVADGYGLGRAGLEALRERGVGLVVTVDCGIGGRDEVALARQLGLDVVVTDHHLVPESIPEAVAVLNPRQAECGYPCKDLPGAGVAYVLARGLYALLEERDTPPALD